MDLDEVSCPSYLVTAVHLCEICTAKEISQGFFSTFSMNVWWALWRKTLREGVDNPNICSPKSFRLFHLPILGIHQIVTSSCILFVGVQLCLSQVRARLCLLSPCSKWLLWQLLALQPQLSLGFKVIKLTVVV